MRCVFGWITPNLHHNVPSETLKVLLSFTLSVRHTCLNGGVWRPQPKIDPAWSSAASHSYIVPCPAVFLFWCGLRWRQKTSEGEDGVSGREGGREGDSLRFRAVCSFCSHIPLWYKSMRLEVKRRFVFRCASILCSALVCYCSVLSTVTVECVDSQWKVGGWVVGGYKGLFSVIFLECVTNDSPILESKDQLLRQKA